MSKWQVGYYRESGNEIVWKSVQANSLRTAMKLADEWVETAFDDALPLSMVVVALENAEHVTALRYLDEHEWILSGKAIGIGLKHRMVR